MVNRAYNISDFGFTISDLHFGFEILLFYCVQSAIRIPQSAILPVSRFKPRTHISFAKFIQRDFQRDGFFTVG